MAGKFAGGGSPESEVKLMEDVEEENGDGLVEREERDDDTHNDKMALPNNKYFRDHVEKNMRER